MERKRQSVAGICPEQIPFEKHKFIPIPKIVS